MRLDHLLSMEYMNEETCSYDKSTHIRFRLMFSFEGSKNLLLYLENFKQKNKKDLVIDEMTRHL